MPTDTPNSLLTLLRAMRDRRSWGTLYLATATQVQMHAREALGADRPARTDRSVMHSAQDFLAYYTNLRNEPAEAGYLDTWLRRHTPMRDRVFRNTRRTAPKAVARPLTW